MKAANELPEIPFVFAGKGPLEKNVATSGLKNVINIGFKYGTELKKIISMSQFCIIPSEWNEPFGLSIIESMQLGVPVIVSGVGGIPELIIDKVNGLVFEAGNKDNLVNKIRNLWNCPSLVESLSRNCLHTNVTLLEDYGEKLINDVYTI